MQHLRWLVLYKPLAQLFQYLRCKPGGSPNSSKVSLSPNASTFEIKSSDNSDSSDPHHIKQGKCIFPRRTKWRRKSDRNARLFKTNMFHPRGTLSRYVHQATILMTSKWYEKGVAIWTNAVIRFSGECSGLLLEAKQRASKFPSTICKSLAMHSNGKCSRLSLEVKSQASKFPYARCESLAMHSRRTPSIVAQDNLCPFQFHIWV